MAEGQGKEIGSVLIAVNSYIQPGTNLSPLLHADQVLSDYIKTFHRFLYFKVTWLFDYTLDAFWSEFHEFFKNPVGDHVAVVLYGHGGIDDKIECLRTKSGPLQIHLLEDNFAQKCPKKNRYLFLDLCRERNTVAPAVYQADTEGTFIVYSTLAFHEAERNLWSRKMAKHLCNHANLSDVIRSVDDEIKREYPSLRQASDEHAKGTSGTPNFRELANFANMKFKTRALAQNLDDAIQNAKKVMDAYRANQAPHNPPFVASKLCNPTDTDPSNQPAQVPDLPIPQAKQPPNNPLVASLGNPPDNPSNQPVLDLPSAQGPRAESKMDEKIGESQNIWIVPEYKKGLISQMSMLAAVLGIDEEATDTLQGNKGADAKLKIILDIYINEKSPTWRDLCTALKKLPSFNNVREKIEKRCTDVNK